MKRALFVLALISAPAAAQDAMDHSGHVMAGMDTTQETGSDSEEPCNAPPPPVPDDILADRYYDAARMKAARMHLAHMGHYTNAAILIDELEYRAVDGRDGYGWKAQAWYGNDHDRIAVTSEGEGAFSKAAEQVETSLLWRHAIDPWFNLEAGLRHDFRPDPERTYAVVGIQGLAPYWFELESQLFVSDQGDVHARLGASYDQRITQRLILEPEAEVNLAFQDVPELGVASGFERIELGARLRYEIMPGVGPYLGVHWERRLGGNADLARQEGESPSQVAAVLGLRAWF